MKSTTFLLITICLFFQNFVSGQAEWTLKKEKNGIKIFSRKVEGFRVNELKVETEMEGTLSQFVAVLVDVNKQTDWVYKTIKCELLKTVSNTDLYYYTEISCPWPFENRDLVVHMTVGQNTVNKVLTIVAKSEDGYLPKKKAIVRLKYSYATWTVTPVGSNHLKIEYKVQIDPGEGVPTWVLNMFSTSGPYESFINLKQVIKLPKYVQARLPFIVN